MEAGRVGRRGKEKTFLRSKKAAERVAPPVGRRRGFEDRSTRKDVDRTGLLMEAATIGSGQPGLATRGGLPARSRTPGGPIARARKSPPPPETSSHAHPPSAQSAWNIRRPA